MPCNWLTVQEYADRLRVHHSTVRAWIKKGTLTHVRVGRVIRVCEGAIYEQQERTEKEIMQGKGGVPH